MKRLDEDLRAHCDITMEELAIFITGVVNSIKAHLRRIPSLREKSVPFISFDGNELLKALGPSAPIERSKKWLDKLEYQSGRNINCSPFLKITVAELGCRYVPIVAVFFPFESFEGAWTYNATKAAKRSTAFGTMGQDWGLIFENYVRERLAEVHPVMAQNRRGKGHDKRKCEKPNSNQIIFPPRCNSLSDQWGLRLSRQPGLCQPLL